MKRNFFILYILLSGVFSREAFAQTGRFGILRGASREILCSYYDRDSSMLFTYDRAGTITSWDVNNMLPVRSFNTVPANIWSMENPLEHHDWVIGANRSRIWIGDLSGTFSAKNGKYDYYGRTNGKQLVLADTSAAIDRVCFFKDDRALIMSRCYNRPAGMKDGKPVYGALTRYTIADAANKQVFLQGIVTALQLSDEGKFVAAGYRDGRVDVLGAEKLDSVFSFRPPADETTGPAGNFVFLKDGKGLAYTGGVSSDKVFLLRYSEKVPLAVAVPANRAFLKLALSPSGKFLAIYSRYKVSVYDLEKEQTAAEDVFGSALFFINSLSFLSDDIMLLAGTTSGGREDGYSVGAVERAGLVKADWKRKLFTSNQSYEPGTPAFPDTEISVCNDSTFTLSRRSRVLHFVTPSSLLNRYVTESLSGFTDPLNDFIIQHGFQPYVSFGSEPGQTRGLLKDDALPQDLWLSGAINNKNSLLVKAEGGDINKLTGYKQFIHIPGYTPVRLNSLSELILWKTNRESKYEFIVSDYKGKILFRDSTGILHQLSPAFSQDGKWFCFQRDGSSVNVYSTRGFSRPLTINTGLPAAQYIADQPQFDNSSARIAYQLFDPSNLNAFTLASTDLKSGKQDTLSHYLMRPSSYALSPDLGKLAMCFPLNFADTAVFKDQRKMAEAAAYGFRNLYRPSVFLLDLKTNAVTVFKAAGNRQILKMGVTSNRVIALQGDGMLYYYNPADTSTVISQWISGADFALTGPGYYYATPGAVKRITQETARGFYPVGEQDIFYNQPHRVMRAMGARKEQLIDLYRLAFEKRIKQYDDRKPVEASGSVPALSLDQSVTAPFYTTDSVLACNLKVNGGVSLKQLFVNVNDYSIYGKKGFPVPAGGQQVKLHIPLTPGINRISVRGLDQDGRYTAPLTLEYTAAYTKPARKPKLWIISAGVSVYADSTYNLRYAAKDASDFVKVFGYKDNYDTVIVRTLLNQQVTAASLISEIRKAGSLGKEDVVVVYLAGHGLLDRNADFYYATHEIRFDDPRKTGLSYERIVSALEALPSTKKALFLDACHSGLVDRSRFKPPALPHDASGARLVAQSRRGIDVENTDSTAVDEQEVFLFMQQEFNDLALDNHVNILSASLGNSFALENDSLQNGLFTYCLIKGIGLAGAAKKFNDQKESERKYGEGSVLDINDISRYLSSEVRRLSRGSQVPTFSLSSNAQQIIFSENFLPLYVFDSDYQPADPRDYKPGKATQYKNFLDRYKPAAKKP